jgi:aldehyde:ferredoxin oxidoreductase
VDFLAQGKQKMAKRLGAEAEKHAWHVKWLDDGTLANADVGRALNYAVATRGADHCRGLPTATVLKGSTLKKLSSIYSGGESAISEAIDFFSYHPVKADILIHTETFLSAVDAVGMCKFNTEWMGQEGVDLSAIAALISLVTGWEVSAEKLSEICQRGYMVERAFGVREGITAKDDIPPKKFFRTVPSGPQKGTRLDKQKFKKLLKIYYQKRGWDVETGIPTVERLEALGLKEVANEIERVLKK